MISIPKNILNKVKQDGDIAFLEDYIINNYPMPQIVKAFAELMMTAEEAVNRRQIIVTEEEMEAINALFKVKGTRLVDGEVIRETRGRPLGARNKIK